MGFTLEHIGAVMGQCKPLNQYILMGSDLWVWIDAGISSTPDQCTLPELNRRGLTPPAKNLLIITHADVDHFGGVSAIKRAIPSIMTVAHSSDTPLISNFNLLLNRRYDAFTADGISLSESRVNELRERAGKPVRVDLEISFEASLHFDGEETWEILHLPGHSQGHLALWNPQTRIAFVGDAVMGWGVVDGNGELQPPHYENVDSYLSSIMRLKELNPKTIYFSHRNEVSGNEVDEFLGDSRGAVELFASLINTALRGTSATSSHQLRYLCEHVSRSSSKWPDAQPAAFANLVAAHLRDISTKARAKI